MNKNIATVVFQNIFSGLTTFFLYRYFLEVIGVEKIGVWSLTIGTLTTLQISNLGIGTAMTRFVAKYQATNQAKKLTDIIQTTFISMMGFFLLGLLLFMPFFRASVGKVFLDTADQGLVIKLMPTMILATWFSVSAMLYQGILDGLRKMNQRAMIQIIASLSYVFLCLLLARSKGLAGLASAYLVQQILLFFCSFLVVRYHLSLPLIPIVWKKTAFKEVFFYSFNFQTMQVTAIITDILCKFLVNHFGGLSWTGYYEMANRMIIQFRAVLVSAVSVFMPEFTHISEQEPLRIKTVYQSLVDVVLLISLPIFGFIVAAAPSISSLWIGHHESIFIQSCYLLGAGWFISTVATPAQFAYLGMGFVKWSTMGAVVTLICSGLVGIPLGILWGGLGVVFAISLGVSLGALVSIVAFQKKFTIKFKNIFHVKNIILLSAHLVFIAGATIFQIKIPAMPAVLKILVMAILFVFVPGCFWWQMPSRVQIFKHLGLNVSKK